ncbi:MAG: type 1 glutamine amidotransferase, partial [Solirubrobacteraceae bacterium]
MCEPETLHVCALYPDLMNIYADRGNLLVLRRRCEWRGIHFQLRGSHIGDELAPGWADLFYVGGGQDRDQRLCAEDLNTRKRDALRSAAADGAVVLGVCGGYQLLGNEYEMDDIVLPGVGLLDIRTVRSVGDRLTGNIAIQPELSGPDGQLLAGFENHA